MARKPIVAGMFYSDDFDELSNQINDSFHSKFGPGDLPVKKRTKEILGIISPHAGYQFSGACAAWAYKEIAESKLAIGITRSDVHSGPSVDDYRDALHNMELDPPVMKIDARNRTDVMNLMKALMASMTPFLAQQLPNQQITLH